MVLVTVESMTQELFLQILNGMLFGLSTISVSGGLGQLQMVLEPGIGRCASEKTEPRRG